MQFKNFPYRLLLSFVVIVFLGQACTEQEVDSEKRGSIIAINPIGSYTKESLITELENQITGISLLFPVTNGIDAYQVVYNTIDPNGNPTICSGVMAIPKLDTDTISLPVASYQHGTVVRKTDAPSINGVEKYIPMALAGNGFLGVATDYLGLGLSPGLHPYIHAKSEATAVIDLLRALRNYCHENDIAYNDKLFLLGYSQGGHATMAAQKEIETNYNKEFKLTAAAPMSGPYSVSGVMKDLMLSEEPYPTPNYLPYLLLTYHKYYGMYNSPSDFLLAPYDSIMPALFDGTHDGWEIDQLMDPLGAPIRIVKPEVVTSFTVNPNHPLWDILRDNDTYNFSPKAPIKMYYCTGDTQVKYLNALVAQDYFLANNQTNTEAVFNNGGDHGDCVVPSLLKAKVWFEQLRYE